MGTSCGLPSRRSPFCCPHTRCCNATKRSLLPSTPASFPLPPCPQVLVVTPGRGAAGLLPGGQAQPSEWGGCRVVEAGSFPCPGYGTVPLSLGLSRRIYREVKSFRPDLVHVTTPGALPAAAWLYSRLLRVPLVASYHTHVPSYLPKLGLDWLVSWRGCSLPAGRGRGRDAADAPAPLHGNNWQARPACC